MTNQQPIEKNRLLLSLFPGVDLFSMPFEDRGFSVVRGPDLIYGRDIRDFHVPSGCFAGVIGGSPCPDFSSARRNEPTGNGEEMLNEFKRVVVEAQPDWWLLENVPRVPDVHIDGYSWQRFGLDLAWFSDCSRLRHFQFGNKSGIKLNPPIGTSQPCSNGAALANDSRSFAELKHLQGLPASYDLKSFNVDGKKRAVGNGVPLPLGRVLSQLIDYHVYGVTDQADKSVTERSDNSVTDQANKSVTCACGCGRVVVGRAKYASAACRKRVSRRN